MHNFVSKYECFIDTEVRVSYLVFKLLKVQVNMYICICSWLVFIMQYIHLLLKEKINKYKTKLKKIKKEMQRKKPKQ